MRRLAGGDQEVARGRWWVLATVLGGLFSVNVVFTLFAVAQDRIAHDLGTDANGLTWAITLPLLAFGIAAPAAGKLGDLLGHRRVYLVGIVGSLVAAVGTALAGSVAQLVVVRTLGQVLGAATGAASMALIFGAFEPGDRVKAMGWWSLVGAGGPVVGVVIGGPVIESVGWRWMFWAQVPLTALAAVAGALVLPDPRPSTADGPRARFDLVGMATLAVGVTAVLIAMNRAPSWGWGSARTLGAFALGAVGLVAFWAAERRAAAPLLPLAWFRRRNFTLGIAAMAFANFAYMGGFILAPRLLERVFGFGEAKVGLVSIARPLTFSLIAPVAGYLAVSIGERVTAVLGSLAITGSMLVFSGLHATSPLVLVLLALALSGLGMGVASPSLAASVANEVEEASLGVASAAQQLLSQVGLVAGIQLLSSLQAGRQAGGLEASFSVAYRLGAVAALVAVGASAFVVRAVRPARSREVGLATLPHGEPGAELPVALDVAG